MEPPGREMTYTVYIPDAERGPTSYTQRQFDTIKALARWAVAAALDEPAVAAPTQPVTDIATSMLQSPAVTELLAQFSGVAERARDPAIVTLISDIEKAVPSFLKPGAVIGSSALGEEDAVEKLKEHMSGNPPIAEYKITPENQAPTIGGLAQAAAKQTPTDPPPVELWEIDTDEWFTDASASEWAAPLRERNWPAVAKKYLEEIQQLFDHTVTNPKSREEALSPEDQWWFKQLAHAYPQHFAENLFPEAQVRWELLPAAFKDACATELKQRKYMKSGSHTTAAHRFAKDAFTILNSLRTGQRHASWKDVSFPAEEGLAWGAPAAEKTAEKLLTMWWSGVKPTDAVREFMLRVVVMRYFKQSVGPATTVGSAEFLAAYTECVRRMGTDGILPAGFLDWATRGTSFKHCKAALTSLGIASVRRADGQKYMNLEEIKEVLREVWVFENDLTDIHNAEGFASFAVWEQLASTSTWASIV